MEYNGLKMESYDYRMITFALLIPNAVGVQNLEPLYNPELFSLVPKVLFGNE